MTRLMLAGALLIIITSTALALGPGFAFGVHANFTTSNFPGPSVSGTNQQISSAYGAGWGGGVHVDANLMVFSFRLSGGQKTVAAIVRDVTKEHEAFLQVRHDLPDWPRPGRVQEPWVDY